ncbi:MAG: inorganic phosphate transporter [Planctomycetota bacterium]
MFDGVLDLGWFPLLVLVVSLLVALGFEFVNGFHDTANAVATVIYTNSMAPTRAVVLSALCNFLGVFAGGIAVAMAILHLLPVELLVAGGTGAGLAMVMALLISAILWNLGTWYVGLPASSSHTLIGAILGVGIAHSLLPGNVFGGGVNWGKAESVGLSLLISPLFGALVAGLLFLLVRALVRDPRLYAPPQPNAPPPRWIQWLLIGTCSGVSFSHGSNDGQKGIGLIMLILVGVLPANFALDRSASAETIEHTVAASEAFERRVLAAGIAGVTTADLAASDRKAVGEGGADQDQLTAVYNRTPKTARDAGLMALHHLDALQAALKDKQRVTQIPREKRWAVRESQLRFEQAWKALRNLEAIQPSPEEQAAIAKDLDALRGLTDYAPVLVIIAVALALGVGTTVGWKRIVVTVGEKIGATHLTYAQGACAELVAMSTIAVASLAGLPVSTTHVLSSGVAGTMVANESGLQGKTVRNIVLAWVLTLPVVMVLSGALYLLFHGLVR